MIILYLQDALQRTAHADAVYVSHTHSDHLNYPTMKALSEINPEMPIYVGDVRCGAGSQVLIWDKDFKELPMNNVNITPFGVWQPLGEHCRFMILSDAVFELVDTCLLIEYKGHYIFNTVDCCSPNNDKFPDGVDLLLKDFAGGASGFPLMFEGGRYTEEWTTPFIKNERKKIIERTKAMIKRCNAKYFIPFAGYFVEAHPSDERVRRLNYKNDPTEFIEQVEASNPDVKGWTPKPGASFDLASGTEIYTPPAGTKMIQDEWEWEPYIADIEKSNNFAPLDTLEGIQFYFDWSGFSDYDLVLHIQETDDAFQAVRREYWIDFLPNKVYLYDPKIGARQNARTNKFRVREACWRRTLQYGLAWDGIYIGFQMMISRSPDTYHIKLWMHHMAPHEEPPQWQQFISNNSTIIPSGERSQQTGGCELM